MMLHRVRIMCIVLLMVASGQLCTEPALFEGLVALDEIILVLPHPDGDILVLDSDVDMSLEGKQRTLRDVVLDGLMVNKARDIGITFPDSVVDEMLTSIQKRYNLGRDQLIESFEAQGFTFAEGRELMRRRKMIDELIGLMAHVEQPSAKEISDYYALHPDIIEESFTVRLGFLRRTPDSDKQSDAKIVAALQKGYYVAQIEWDEPEIYYIRQLTEGQEFVKLMQPGEIKIMAKSDEGYDLVQLVASTPQQIAPVNEAQVIAQIVQDRLQASLALFQEELLSKAKIRFCKAGISLADLH